MRVSDHTVDDFAVRARAVIGRIRPYGAIVGLGLLIAAIVVVARSGTALQAALQALRDAPLSNIALLLGSSLASVFLTGSVFWILTNRFGRVPFVEMQALMASTTLANYLPLRPGLVARVAYHRTKHGIRARDGLRTIIEAMLLSLVALALLVPSLLVRDALGVPLALALAMPALLAAPAMLHARSRALAMAWELRYAETLLTALRYHIAFQLIGAPVPAATSCAIACVSMIATLVPFVSNGIGLREWAIGLMSPLLAGYSIEQGISAELLHRAAEIIVVVPTGLLGLLWLWRLPRTPTEQRSHK